MWGGVETALLQAADAAGKPHQQRCLHAGEPPRQGHESWQSIASYPYEEFRRRYKGVALVEVTVIQGVSYILEMTTHIEEFVL